MSDRIKRRMAEVGSTGLGAGFKANQAISFGLSEEEAEKAARVARDEAIVEVDGDTEVEEIKEVPPPDKLNATPQEVETAGRLVELLRSMPDSRDMEEEDWLRNKELRILIEKNLEPIDISDLMFTGSVSQLVPLGGGKLTLKLTSLTTQHYALIDRWIYSHLMTNIALPLKHRLRFLLAAACTIDSVDGRKSGGGIPWPDASKDVLMPEFREWSAFFEARLQWLLGMNPSIVELFSFNVTWFEQRVRRAIGDLAYVGQEIKK